MLNVSSNSGWGKLLPILIILSSSIVFGYTIDEIRELQKLGFSNQQIVDLQNKQDGMTTSQDGINQAPAASPDVNLAKMRLLQEKGTGLLIVCFSKEWISRGPGYLYFDRKAPDGKWIPIGQAMVLNYANNGGFGPPRIEHNQQVLKEHVQHDKKHGHDGKKHHKDCGGGKDCKKYGCDGKIEKEVIIHETIIHPRELVTSRYYAEFEMQQGQYDLKAERLFFTGENENTGFIKIRRHRKINGVMITAGRVTILSYFWGENSSFGLDHPVPPHHQIWIHSVTARFSPLLAEIKY